MSMRVPYSLERKLPRIVLALTPFASYETTRRRPETSLDTAGRQRSSEGTTENESAPVVLLYASSIVINSRNVRSFNHPCDYYYYSL